jgi:hypothetical protein
MATKLRKSPPVCLAISIIRLIFRRLRYSGQYLGKTIQMPDGEEFTVFRHITAVPPDKKEAASVLIARFRFARLSNKANKIVSKIPMLLITGFPGFHAKIYAENKVNGHWQGMYEWKSKAAQEEYKESFVLALMNKRAIKGSVTYLEFDDHHLSGFIEKMLQPGNNLTENIKS